MAMEKKRANSRASAIGDDSERDKKVFLSIDLDNSKSVAEYFPLVENRGVVRLVPVDLRVEIDKELHEQNPRNVFRAIERFRQMSGEQQGKEINIAVNLSCKERERVSERLVALKVKKGLLDNNKLDWETITETSAATTAKKKSVDPSQL
jgi:hypothetical protein